MPKTLDYDLWIDESGTFQETSTDKHERRGASQQHFPSQLAGLLVPRGELDRNLATGILHAAHAAASLAYQPGQEVHAYKIHDQDAYNALLESVSESINRKRGWWATRIANTERVIFGDRVTTYTMMLAELMLRIYERLAEEHDGEIHINATCAIVVLKHRHDGSPEFMDEQAYSSCLRRELSRAAIARGLAAESGRWRFSLRLGSGLKWPELQLCDIVSNGSKGDFDRCSPQAKAKLVKALGDFDLSLTLRTLDRRIDELLDAGSLGSALQLLGTSLMEDEMSVGARTSAEERLRLVLERLARQPAPTRDLHLAVLGPWLDQYIEEQRNERLGIELAAWIIEHVLTPIQAIVDQGARATLDAHAYDVRRRLLSAANHSGALHLAREQSTRLDELAPSLAGHWEHAPILVEGMLAQAVHHSDCFAQVKAISLMGALDGYYDALADLMHHALPSVFPERVRSEQRAKALGTWLQAEMMAAVREPERFEQARQLNDRAIAEFSAPGDIARQQQYRCHLETLAGCWSDARSWLTRSLGTPGTSHGDLAKSIGSLEGIPHAFALLHWLRLGAALHTRGPADERNAFDAAFRSLAPWKGPWVTEPHRGYPAHGIRRFCAVVLAGQGKLDRADNVLARLEALTPLDQGQPLLALLVLGAQVEVAALTWHRDEQKARRLLEHPERGALKQHAHLLTRMEGLDIPLRVELTRWPTAIQSVLDSPTAAREASGALLHLTAPLAW